MVSALKIAREARGDKGSRKEEKGGSGWEVSQLAKSVALKKFLPIATMMLNITLCYIYFYEVGTPAKKKRKMLNKIKQGGASQSRAQRRARVEKSQSRVRVELEYRREELEKSRAIVEQEQSKCREEQSRARVEQVEQSRVEQSRAKQSRARVEKSRVEQEQSRVEQSRVEQEQSQS